MKLFNKKLPPDYLECKDQSIQKMPLLISNLQAEAEIKELRSSRELRHLKQRFWKFYHK